MSSITGRAITHGSLKGEFTITFGEEKDLKKYLNKKTPLKSEMGKDFYLYKENEYNKVFYQEVYRLFPNNTFTVKELEQTISIVHKKVFATVTKDDNSLSFAANLLSSSWCREFYRLCVPKAFQNF